VVQVYADPAAPKQPVRLVGWSSATLDPGETAEVTVATDARLWRRWDSDQGAWGEPLPYDGRLLIARGLGDVRATLPLG
jgi:beta-glucosidase